MHESLRTLREHGASGCVVLGEPGYYGRFGFRAEPGLILPDIPPEYFQAISFGSAMPSGTVAYDESFNVHG
jgi:predicted N-acetyltransferase YhbS